MKTKNELIKKMNKKITSGKINNQHTFSLIKYFNQIVKEHNKIEEVRTDNNGNIVVVNNKKFATLSIPSSFTKKDCKAYLLELNQI